MKPIFFLFVFLLGLLAPSVVWLDSSDLASSIFTFGISHSPGQVIYVLVGGLFGFIPFGDFGYRVTLYSLLVVCAGLYMLFYDSSRSDSLSGWTRGALGILLGFSLGFVLQAVRIEVYALAAVVSMGSILCFLQRDDHRWNLCGWLMFSLAIQVHPVIALGVLPWVRFKPWKICVLTFVLPFVYQLYLPLRAFSDAAWKFGFPTSFTSYYEFVSGKMYPAYNSLDTLLVLRQYIEVCLLFVRCLGWDIFFLGALSFVYLLTKGKLTWCCKVLASTFLAIFLIAMQPNFWPTNPDAKGYLLLSCFLWGWMILKVLFLKREKIRETLTSKASYRVLSLVAISTLLIGKFLYASIESNFSKDWSSHRHRVFVLSKLQNSSHVSASNFSHYSLLSYGKIVEGRRPDVGLSFRGLAELHDKNFTAPFYWEPRLTREENAMYRLSLEDRKRIPRLYMGEWFYTSERQSASSEQKHFAAIETHTKKVIEEAAIYDHQEALALQYIKYILFAKAKGNQALKNDLVKQTKKLFPTLQGLEEL